MPTADFKKNVWFVQIRGMFSPFNYLNYAVVKVRELIFNAFKRYKIIHASPDENFA